MQTNSFAALSLSLTSNWSDGLRLETRCLTYNDQPTAADRVEQSARSVEAGRCLAASHFLPFNLVVVGVVASAVASASAAVCVVAWPAP